MILFAKIAKSQPYQAIISPPHAAPPAAASPPPAPRPQPIFLSTSDKPKNPMSASVAPHSQYGRQPPLSPFANYAAADLSSQTSHCRMPSALSAAAESCHLSFSSASVMRFVLLMVSTIHTYCLKSDEAFISYYLSSYPSYRTY